MLAFAIIAIAIGLPSAIAWYVGQFVCPPVDTEE